MNKKIGLLSMALCAMSCLAGCGSSTGFKSGTYKIGVSGPLTGGGAVYGNAVANSAQMAVDEINAAGGLNGNKFSLEAMDDDMKSENSAVNYAALKEKGMQVSLGCVTSGAMLEYGKSAQKDNVFCLTPSATNDGVYALGDCAYQMCFSDSGQGIASANYITKYYADKKLGIFYDTSEPYSVGIYENFIKTFTGTVAVTATYTSETASDFSAQVQQLKDCDVIFMPIYYTPASLFIQTAKSTMKSNAIYFGCDGFDGIDAVKGFDVKSYTQEISMLSHFNSGSTDKATADYVSKYTNKYGTDTLNQFGAAAYDCVYAIYNAMKAYGKDIDVEISASDLANILKGVFQSESFTYSGVTGTNVKWNADGTVSKEAKKYIINQK